MHVLKDKKVLLFRLREPKRITTVIPSAKMVNIKGTEFVAVPHGIDETKVLRNLGFDVPAPMSIYYDYPAKFTPFEAQRKSAEFASMNDRCFILNSMGLGKTMTALWTYDFMRKQGKVNKVLVVAPLSTLERTWSDEVFFSFPRYKVNVLHGTREKRLRLLADTSADIYVINTDGIKLIKDELASRPDIDLVIIDELALFRNKMTDRWKAMNAICNKQSLRKVWGLTGSPIPNAPTDAWAQARLVNPTNPFTPKYFSEFQNRTMLQTSPYKWEPKPTAVDDVYKILQPAVRYDINECLDLPEQVFTTRTVELSKEQYAAYRQMMANLLVLFKNGEITASNDAVKASKLLQITLGAAYGDDGETIELSAKPRLEALLEVVESSEGKVLVFVPFTGALNAVADFLRSKNQTVEIVDGSVSKAERDRIFGLFQKTDAPRIIVANPAAMSHGLTLTAATTIVWYGPTYSNEIYQQACARVRRPGQTKTTVIVHLVSTQFEAKIFERLQGKQKVQGTLLELMRETTNAKS